MGVAQSQNRHVDTSKGWFAEETPRVGRGPHTGEAPLGLGKESWQRWGRSRERVPAGAPGQMLQSPEPGPVAPNFKCSVCRLCSLSGGLFVAFTKSAEGDSFRFPGPRATPAPLMLFASRDLRVHHWGSPAGSGCFWPLPRAPEHPGPVLCCSI